MSQWQTAGKVRMTPKGTWSTSTAYVVLDCVSNTDKTAYYVAKQNVPAGTVLTNTEYWEVVNDISDIVYQLTNEIERLEDIVALGYPTVSGTGKFVNIEGTIDAPPSGLTIYGKSVQSNGTPTPSAPADIVTAGSGGTLAMVSAGKNLFTRPYYRESASGSGAYTHNGVTFTLNPNGSITASGTATGGNAFYNLSYINQQTHILPAGTYTISGGINASKYVYVRNADSSVSGGGGAQPATITLPSTSAINAVVFIAEGATCNDDVFWPQIEPGNEATEYVAPISNATVAIPTSNGLPGIPVASGGNYTDTSGQQWICDTIDLETGMWTKRTSIYTVTGSESISKSSESALDTYLVYFPTGTPDLVKNNTAFLCTHFNNSGVTAVGNAEIPTTGNYLRIRCHYANAGTSTVETFTEAITGMIIVYALATPVVTQLTSAQLTALQSIRSRKRLTNMYSADLSAPEFNAEMYIDIPTYINSLVN